MQIHQSEISYLYFFCTLKEFYKYFKVNDKIRDLEFNKDYLNIFSKDVLKQIKNNTPGWEDKLPEGVPDLIIKKKMFGYK